MEMDRNEARETALNELTADGRTFQDAICDVLDTLSYALDEPKPIAIPYAYEHNRKVRVARAAERALMVLLNPSVAELATFTEREKAIRELLLLQVEPQLQERADELTTTRFDEDEELRRADNIERARDMRAELRRVA